MKAMKAETNEAIISYLEKTIEQIRAKSSLEEEQIQLLAFVHTWTCQITMYFDFLFYSEIYLFDLSEDDVQQYLSVSNRKLEHALTLAEPLNRLYSAQIDMRNAFKRCVTYLVKHCKYDHSLLLQKLDIEITVFIHKTFDQYLKSFFLISHSKEFIARYAERDDRPSIKDLNFKVMSDDGQSMRIIATLPVPLDNKLDDDKIEVVSSSNAVSANNSDDSDDDETDWD